MRSRAASASRSDPPRPDAKTRSIRSCAGVPPTGRAVVFQATESYRVAGDRIAEQWVVMDTLGLLQQLGATLSPPPASDVTADLVQTASLEHEDVSAPSLAPEVDTA
jgi:hypothetical protein